MVKDIAPELLEEVKQTFDLSYENNDQIKSVLDKIGENNAGYLDVHDYAIEVGRLSAEAFKKKITIDKLPNGRMYYNIANRVVQPVLENNYSLVIEASRKVQKILNNQANISHIYMPPKLNKNRIDGIINRLTDSEDFDEIKWILDDPVINFTQSVVDDAIKTNADFQFKTGMSPKIVRIASPGACDWCRKMAGTYNYGEEPQDIYRRHQNCTCRTDYIPGNGKHQDVWSKRWSNQRKENVERRKQLSIDLLQKQRQNDIKEFKELIKILGVDKSPVSVAQLQYLKYNKVEEYERLKDREFIQKRIINGIWPDKINPEKQLRHMQTTAVEGKSYFFDNVDVTELYNRFKMTGKVVKNRKNRIGKEQIDLPTDFSVGVDTYSGNLANGLTIHYSNTGAHIVPTYYERR